MYIVLSHPKKNSSEWIVSSCVYLRYYGHKKVSTDTLFPLQGNISVQNEFTIKLTSIVTPPNNEISVLPSSPEYLFHYHRTTPYPPINPPVNLHPLSQLSLRTHSSLASNTPLRIRTPLLNSRFVSYSLERRNLRELWALRCYVVGGGGVALGLGFMRNVE